MKDLEYYINPFIHTLNRDSHDYHKKSLELCHIGKFLFLIDEDYFIKTLMEAPDCIISNNYNDIGLEHETLTENQSKAIEGSIQEVFRLAEKEYLLKNPNSKFLMNIWLKESCLSFKKNGKRQIIDKILDIVSLYIQKGYVIENDIIESILMLRHSRLSLNPNLGAWYQRELDYDLLRAAILKKEKLLNSYKKNTGLSNQWLLIVIGSLDNSSFEIMDKFEFEIDSFFSRVYLMEDFNSKIFRIK